MQVPERRLAPAVMCSLGVHVLFLAALAILAVRPGSPSPRAAVSGGRPLRLVWLSDPGRGGGGGGGGNRMKNPPRRAEKPGRGAATIDAERPRPLAQPARSPVDHTPAPLIAPVLTVASGIHDLPGAIDTPPAPASTSQGPGSDGGAGRGRGRGDGPGAGDGIGPGTGIGTGDGPYRPGGDVTMPIEIRKGTPQYTTEAMRARAQGQIVVQCVVQTTGVCTNIRVTRSFDPSFGLDQEAIKAAAQWRFRPGTRRGQPVPVLVTMEIAFALR